MSPEILICLSKISDAILKVFLEVVAKGAAEAEELDPEKPKEKPRNADL